MEYFVLRVEPYWNISESISLFSVVQGSPLVFSKFHTPDKSFYLVTQLILKPGKEHVSLESLV